MVKSCDGVLVWLPRPGASTLIDLNQHVPDGWKLMHLVKQVAHAVEAFITVSLCLTGCGAPSSPSTALPSQAGNKPDVSVTLDGARHTCLVALPKEEQGSSIACADIVPFLRDELRLPAGATFDVHATPDVTREESSAVRDRLKNAGYRSVGAA